MGVRLVLDLFTPITFEYVLKEIAPDQWEGEYFLEFPSKLFPIKNLLVFSYPPLLCNNGIIYTKCPDVTLKDGNISPDEIEQEEGVSLHEQPLTARPYNPTPILQLTDRTGGFANLAFEGKKDAEQNEAGKKIFLKLTSKKKSLAPATIIAL